MLGLRMQLCQAGTVNSSQSAGHNVQARPDILFIFGFPSV
jgi:hypothetical protein